MITSLACRRMAWLCVGCLAVGAPALAQSRTLELVGTIPGPATTVHVQGTVAYIASGPTLQFFDIGDPTAPTLVGSFTFSQNIYGVRVSRSIAYVAIDFGGLGILDVSNPAAATLLASLEVGGQALSVGITGSTAVVANRLSGLEVIDVTDPRMPVSRGAYYTEGYAMEVDTAGAFAYVVDRPGGLSIIDLSKTGEPIAESVVSTTDWPAAVAVSSDASDAPSARIAALLGTDSLLEIVDVSDPSAPVAISSYRHPDRPAIGRTLGGGRIRMEGSLAFLADGPPSPLLQVLELADPTRPTLVATYALPGSPRDMSVSGSLALLAVAGRAPSTAGVLILRMGS